MFSPIYRALELGHMTVLDKLIAQGSYACIESLELAIETGQDEVVQKILDAGASVNGSDKYKRMTRSASLHSMAILT